MSLQSRDGVATILVIDDDPMLLRLLSIMLQRHDYRVETASGGTEGIQKAGEVKPALVLLDVMMPQMDGWETFKHLQENVPGRIVFLTAKTDVMSIAHGLELGACDYICKPVNLKELATRITAVLSWSTPLELVSADEHPECDLPAFACNPPWLTPYAYEKTRRLLDLFGAAVGCILFGLLLLPVAIFIKLDSPGPIFFKQVRIGKDGKAFTVYKFRSMNSGTPSYTQNGTFNTEIYITRVGRLLRQTHLDEFPQFYNVLKGQMSLVGPRPELPNIVATYCDHEKGRLSVKPGITGWWQVSGRPQPMQAYTELDLTYITHRSLTFDLYILFLTVIGKSHAGFTNLWRQARSGLGFFSLGRIRAVWRE